MTQLQKMRVNCDYGVLVHQLYLVIGEKMRKQALSKNLNAMHSRNRQPNSRFTKASKFTRRDSGQLTVIRTHVKPYVMPLFKGYEIGSTTMSEILS